MDLSFTNVLYNHHIPGKNTVVRKGGECWQIRNGKLLRSGIEQSLEIVERIAQSAQRGSLLDGSSRICKRREFGHPKLVDWAHQLRNRKIGYGINVDRRESDAIDRPP